MQDFFYNVYKKEDEFFAEGPAYKPNIKNAINSSSIDTRGFDKYRQGVEITQIKHYDLSIFTPSAGNPGHYLGKLNFGTDRVRAGTDFFVDQVKFDPQKYIENQPEILIQIKNPTSYVVDTDIVDTVAYDGAIEPLTIRAKSTFSSIDFPHESHDTRGDFMGGTSDQLRSSCQILTVDYRRVTSTDFVPYLDAVDMSENKIPTAGFFIFDKTEIFPYDDSNPSRDTFLNITKLESDMYEALLQMNPTTENYISHKCVSATAGWDYDNNISTGTDSITFGGLTYLCRPQNHQEIHRQITLKITS